MSEPKGSPIGCGLYAAAMIFGLFLGFSFFLGIMLGDCIPRDNSAAMHACDASKGLGCTAFPPILLAFLLSSALAMWLRRRVLAVLLAAGAPFLSVAALLVLERVLL